MIKKKKSTVDKVEKVAQLQAAADMYGKIVKVPQGDLNLQADKSESTTPSAEVPETDQMLRDQNHTSQTPLVDPSDQSSSVDEQQPPIKKSKPHNLADKDTSLTLENPHEAATVKRAALHKAKQGKHIIEPSLAEKQGMEEAIKEEAKKQVRDIAKMQELVDTAPRPLLVIQAVFPFDFFPDRLTIEETRVNIIYRQFFATEQVRSIAIQDVMEVTVQTALIFASLKIVARTFNPTNIEPLQVNYLKIADAQKARRLIEGLKIAIQQQVDTSKLNVDELLAKADELGTIHRGETETEP